MLEVEARIGQPLGAYLRSSYEDGYKTTYELAEENEEVSSEEE